MRADDISLDVDFELPQDILSIFSTETIVFGSRGARRPGRAMAESLRGLRAAEFVAAYRRDLLDAGLFRGAPAGAATDPAIADRYYEATERGGARIWPFAPYSAPGAPYRHRHGGLSGAGQSGAGRHHRPALILQPRLVQRYPE